MGLLAWIRDRGRWRREHIEAFSAVTTVQSDGLTLFQHQAISAVAPFVNPEQFNRVEMDKEEGSYLVSSLGSDGAELYIYPNEVCIFGAKPYSWFEEWDYRTPDDLLQKLVEECASRAA